MSRVDLHLVTYFVAVVDHGGITKAAQSMYISQPSLSQAIRTLERRLGVTLFDRTGRRLELTDAGRKLDAVARLILADVERAKAKVRAVRDLQSGRVDVVTYPAFSIAPLVSIVRAFRERFPRLVVRINATDGPAGVLSALRRGESEVGVIDMSADHQGFTVVPLGSQELVLALPDDLFAEVADPTPRTAVTAVPLIVDMGDQSTVGLLADLVAADAANVVVDTTLPACAWDLVRRGAGATVLPRVVAERELPSVPVRALDPPLRREYGMVLRPGRPSPAALAFVAAARADAGIDTDIAESTD